MQSAILAKPVDPVRQWPWDILLHVAEFSNRTRFASDWALNGSVGISFRLFIYLADNYGYYAFHMHFGFSHFKRMLALVVEWCELCASVMEWLKNTLFYW